VSKVSSSGHRTSRLSIPRKSCQSLAAINMSGDSSPQPSCQQPEDPVKKENEESCDQATPDSELLEVVWASEGGTGTTKIEYLWAAYRL
jgi:hypothetical protein